MCPVVQTHRTLVPGYALVRAHSISLTFAAVSIGFTVSCRHGPPLRSSDEDPRDKRVECWSFVIASLDCQLPLHSTPLHSTLLYSPPTFGLYHDAHGQVDRDMPDDAKAAVQAVSHGNFFSFVPSHLRQPSDRPWFLSGSLHRQHVHNLQVLRVSQHLLHCPSHVVVP